MFRGVGLFLAQILVVVTRIRTCERQDPHTHRHPHRHTDPHTDTNTNTCTCTCTHRDRHPPTTTSHLTFRVYVCVLCVVCGVCRVSFVCVWWFFLLVVTHRSKMSSFQMQQKSKIENFKLHQKSNLSSFKKHIPDATKVRK